MQASHGRVESPGRAAGTSCSSSARQDGSAYLAFKQRHRRGVFFLGRALARAPARRPAPSEPNASASASRLIDRLPQAGAAGEIVDRGERPGAAGLFDRSAASSPQAVEHAEAEAEEGEERIEDARSVAPNLSDSRLLAPRSSLLAPTCNPSRCDSHPPAAPRRHGRGRRARVAPAGRSPSAGC